MVRVAYQIALIGLLFVGVDSVRADPARPMFLTTDASEVLLEEGRRHLFAFRMNAAEQSFRQLLQQPSGAEAAYYQLAMVALFKGLVTDDEAYFEQFMARSDTLRHLLEERPASTWKQQFEASTNLQRTVASGKLGHYVRAALAARSAYKGFEQLVEDHPEFDEAYMGMGLLHLTVASLPAGYRQLLSVLGFSGSAEQGIRELRRAATQSRFNQELAHMSIALADIILLDRIPAGADRLGELYERDPESLLYAHLYGFGLYTNRQPEQAKSVLQPAVEKQQSPRYFYIDYLDYYLAEAHFVQNEFEAAIAAYRRYLERHDGPALRALGLYRLGLALEMQRRRQEAVQVYQKVEAPRDFDSDVMAQRRAHMRLEAPMTPLDRQLIRGENAFFSRAYATAEELLRGVFQDSEATPENKARAAFYIGRVHHVQEEYAQAYPAYYYAVEHPGHPEAEWGPWAQLHIGDMYAEQERTQEAVQAYRKALNWETPFDYYQSLEQRARLALERLQGA